MRYSVVGVVHGWYHGPWRPDCPMSLPVVRPSSIHHVGTSQAGYDAGCHSCSSGLGVLDRCCCPLAWVREDQRDRSVVYPGVCTGSARTMYSSWYHRRGTYGPRVPPPATIHPWSTRPCSHGQSVDPCRIPPFTGQIDRYRACLDVGVNGEY